MARERTLTFADGIVSLKLLLEETTFAVLLNR